MDTGLQIYFSSLVVLAIFFLGGAIAGYRSNKESKARGWKISIFNVLFVFTIIVIGASGAYMTYDLKENTRQAMPSVNDP